jgi:acyl-CoA synthetase (AMP-forming)/AMP-acid ligase II
VAVCGFGEKELGEWSVKNMARFQVPSIIEFVPSIAEAPAGKANKANLSKEDGKRLEIIRGIMNA